MIRPFSTSFDHKTPQDLADHLREHANRVAGSSPSGKNYDPETLCLEMDAAREIERLHALVEAARSAWQSLGGDLRHSAMCGPKNVLMHDAPSDDERCDCGARELYRALEDLTHEER